MLHFPTFNSDNPKVIMYPKPQYNLRVVVPYNFCRRSGLY